MIKRQNPTAYLFELGGVLFYPLSEEIFSKMADLTDIFIKDLQKKYIDERPAYETGTITAKEYWKNVAGVEDPEAVQKLIDLDMTGWFGQPRPETLRVLSHLSQKNIPLYVFSNVPYEGIKYLEESYPWFQIMFSQSIFSCNIKHRKPEEEAFSLAQLACNLPPLDITFIDNTLDNIVKARELGFNTIHFQGVFPPEWFQTAVKNVDNLW